MGQKRAPQKWYYPSDIADDLQGIDLSPELKAEALACAWEYSRCVIPQYTNWKRYVAFMRIIISAYQWENQRIFTDSWKVGIIAEFKGSMVKVLESDNILGYSLDGTLAELFEGTVGHADMAREYKTFLLVTAEKTNKDLRDGEFFRRYVNALASAPQRWFRLRDCDALARFTIASALACNDLDHVWFTDEQFDILTEIGDTLYDAVAFYKHRAEGETNNTFAYVPEDNRIEAFRVAREVLWALDTAEAEKHHPKHMIVTNFVRFFGGPIHMMMRRYRFVEEDLSVGKIEDDAVVQQTRQNFKLWNRVDANMDEKDRAEEKKRYEAILTRQDDLMFRGFAAILQMDGEERACSECKYRASYGATKSLRFGGVELCGKCREYWRSYQETLPQRAKRAFPNINLEPELPRADSPLTGPEWQKVPDFSVNGTKEESLSGGECRAGGESSVNGVTES